MKEPICGTDLQWRVLHFAPNSFSEAATKQSGDVNPHIAAVESKDWLIYSFSDEYRVFSEENSSSSRIDVGVSKEALFLGTTSTVIDFNSKKPVILDASRRKHFFPRVEVSGSVLAASSSRDGTRAIFGFDGGLVEVYSISYGIEIGK